MQGRVAVVGGSGVGVVFSVGRSPDAGESVLADEMRVMSGGKSANQAIGVATLGGACSFVSAVGDDVFRDAALERLIEAGVDVSGVVTKAAAGTMLGSVVVDGSGDNRIVIAPNALAALTPADIETQEERIAAADVCLVGLEIPVAPALRALEIARAHGVTTILNPAPSPPGESVSALLAQTDIVVPNQTEAAAMTGTDGDAAAQARALVGAGAGTAVVTVGARGAVVFDGKTVSEVPAPTVTDVVDTSGAGDAFNAALAVVLAGGAPLLDACRLGCEAGARIVRGPGFVDALHTWEGLADAVDAALVATGADR